MIDPKQQMRYSKSEIELLKITFKDKQRIYAVRNFLWQFDLTDEEKEMLKLPEEVKPLIKKVFCPEPVNDVPVFQQVDLYTSLYKIREMQPGLAYLHILANDILVDFISGKVNELLTGEVKDFNLNDLVRPTGKGEEETRVVNMIAFHNIEAYIEGRVNELLLLTKDEEVETPEEKEKRLKANSNK